MNPTDSSPVLAAGASALWQAVCPRLILASASQIRVSLLRAAGLAVTSRPAMIDEAAMKHAARRDGASADDTALLLAELKARQIIEPAALIIGADQLLVCDGQWYDKPADPAEARANLMALRRRTHVLHTATVIQRDGQTIWRHISRPSLTMRAFSDAALDAYLTLEGEKILCSVGAYRLEGPGMHLFEAIEGEHAAILGMPLLALLDFLRRQGLLLA